MELALKIVAAVAITTYMLQLGLGTSTRELQAMLHRRGELARILLVMVVLGPLAARGLAGLFALDVRPGAALVLVAITGVVPLASRGAERAHGDVTFALGTKLLLALVTAFTAAPSIYLLFSYKGPLAVPTLHVLRELLLLQVLPIAIGMFVRARVGARALRLAKWLGIANTAILAAILVIAVVLLPRYGAVRSLGWSGVIASVVFACFLAAAAYLVVGPDRKIRRSAAVIANKPNVMLSIWLVSSASVDAGFAIAVVGVFLVRVVTGVVIQQLLARSAARDRTTEISPQAA
jgi:predicted Na+-dependent transporter